MYSYNVATMQFGESCKVAVTELKRVSYSDGWGTSSGILGKNIWTAWPLSEITIQPVKNLGGLGKIWGPVPPGPNIEPPLSASYFRCIQAQ